MHTVCRGGWKVLERFTDSSWQQLPEDPLIHGGAGLAHASHVAGSPGSPLILALAVAAGSFLSTARHLNSSSFFASAVFWLAVWFSCQLGPVLNHLCRAILQCVTSPRKAWAAAVQLMNLLGFPYLPWTEWWGTSACEGKLRRKYSFPINEQFGLFVVTLQEHN